MPTVRELLKSKGDQVYTIDASASVLDAARVMNNHKIGAVVVLDEGTVVGILTERDILMRVVAPEREPSHTPVTEVMTAPVLTCQPDTKQTEARSVMRDKRIRHLPVANESELTGMISIGDLNQADNRIMSETIRHMEVYIAGGGPM